MNSNASHQGISRRSVLKTGGAASGTLAWSSPAVVGETAGKTLSIAYLYRGDRVSEGDVLVLDDPERRETATGFCHSCRERIHGKLFHVRVEGKRTRSVHVLTPNRSFSADDRVKVAVYDSCVDGRECDDRTGGTSCSIGKSSSSASPETPRPTYFRGRPARATTDPSR